MRHSDSGRPRASSADHAAADRGRWHPCGRRRSPSGRAGHAACANRERNEQRRYTAHNPRTVRCRRSRNRRRAAAHGMWRRPTGAGKKGCVLLGSKVLTTMAKPGRHAGSLSNRRACFSEWRAWWLPSTVAIRPLDSRQLYRSNFDDLFQLTTAKPFAGSSTCRWPRSRPWVASTCSGVHVGTSGKTGRPPGNRTSGARGKWKTS